MKKEATVTLLVAVLLALFVSETNAALVTPLDNFEMPTSLSITTLAGQNNLFYYTSGAMGDIFGGQRDLTLYYDSDVAGRTINLSVENGVFFVQTDVGVRLKLQVDYDGTDNSQILDGTGLDGFNFGSSSTAVTVKARVTNNVGFDLLSKDYYYPPIYNMSKTFTNSGSTQTFTVPFSTMGGTWFQIGSVSFNIRMPPDTKAYFRDFATFKSEIKGKVFVDLNRSGRRDAGEAGYSRQVIKAVDQNGFNFSYYTTASPLGVFSFSLFPGNYLICANDTLLVPTNPATGCTLVTVVGDADTTGVLLGYEPLKVSVQVTGVSVLTEASASSFLVTVTRNVPSDADLNVFLSLSGTATKSSYADKKRNGVSGDYGLGGIQVNNDKFSVQIYAGYSSTDFQIDVESDDLIEGTEDIVVTLMSSGFYEVIGIPLVTLQIIDSPQLSISVFPLGLQQSLRKVFTFTVSLTFALDQDATVRIYRGGNAILGLEYTLSLPFDPYDEAVLLFPAGTTSYSFTATPSTIPISDTDVYITIGLVYPEGSEDYTVSYYEDRVDAYIVRDDFEVQVTNDYISALTETPQQSTGITFRRPGAVCPVLIEFTISGTATYGVDYYISSIYGDFKDGLNTVQLYYDSDAYFNIVSMPDAVVEPNETIIVTINPNQYYFIDPANASTTVIIVDS
eukprot:TRINITY_DN352_c0_g1_i1.p1 TRINITY_DN352_c0_g1~~TRINITY_DN352_c0_g1_i1.p1  ORF type:complete len:688 (+),score=214.08 TRINITY_DN352_c0_g1_i1:37-2064(+)